jgi:hypothetical protein
VEFLYSSSLPALIYCGVDILDIAQWKYQMKYRNALSGKVLSAILLVAALFFGGGIIVAIANFLSEGNPLHFWLPPIFAFSWFIALLVYLSRGKRDEGQENFDKTQPDKREEPSQDVSANLATVELAETIQNKPSKNTAGKKNNKYQKICLIGFILAFGILFLSSLIAGGTAISGKIENGRFFLGEHGAYTEVTRLGYILSTVNTFVMGVLFPFAASWKSENIESRQVKRFRLFFVVFASFIGGGFALASLRSCILAILTAN